MLVVGRIIGIFFLVFAAIALFRDALNWYETGQIVLLSGARYWLALGPGSYYSTEDFLTINVPPLWDPVLVFILGLPAFVVSTVLGLFFGFGSREPAAPKKPKGATYSD